MRKKILSLVILSFLCTAAVAQDYISLYDDCNYSGRRFTLEAGSYRVSQIKIANDRLSSLKIPDGMKVTIYENDKFEGRSKTYYANTPCLENEWRNMASSLVVEKEFGRPGHGQNDYIIFYNDCNSRGYSQSLRPGSYTGSQLGASRYNISSFTIYGNLRVRVYLNNESLSGSSATFETSQTCLPGYQNDNIGSLVIEYKPSQPNYPGGGNGNNGNGNNGNGNNGNYGNYATVYTDCNYRGNSLRLAPGYYQGDKLGLLKYNISSIEIPSNLTAKVYLNNEYLSGAYYSIDANINCMTNDLNNRIGSLVIEEHGGGGGNGGHHQYPQPAYEKVVLYADKDYKGQSSSILPGKYNTMTQAGFIDKALSSLKIPVGYRVVLYEDENFRGRSYTLTESRGGLSLMGWNDKASSIAIYRD